MCLLVFAWQTERGCPVAVAANRDERFDRPARSLCVLRRREPRILGGRDELAGGTWLAVNEHGVVAGLTNRPSPEGRDPTRRSRGELPLLAAGHPSADQGVEALLARVTGGQYNPAWLLVGDRRSLWYVEVDAERPPTARPLRPGVHILENAPLDDPSPKVDRVRAVLGTYGHQGSLWPAFPAVLADHLVPAPLAARSGTRRPDGPWLRPAATYAACVHSDGYGTRSAAVVRVPDDPAARPDLQVADGPPCTAPFVSADGWWTS
jgi:uncharacterized protein with NRDE domain